MDIAKENAEKIANLNITPYKISVGEDNEDILNDEFWTRQDIIINCSDNMATKKYLRQKSKIYEIPLLDSTIDSFEGET